MNIVHLPEETELLLMMNYFTLTKTNGLNVTPVNNLTLSILFGTAAS